jgi:hypothetical protein
MIAASVTRAGGEERQMRRHAVLGALLLIALGVMLGATLFRSEIAHATGLTQGVKAASSDGQPVKSRSSGPNSRSLTLEYLNGADDEKFASIRANLMTIQGDTFGRTTWIYLFSEGQLVMYFFLEPSERIVLPLSKSVKVDEVDLEACFGSTQCFAQVNLIGS